MNHLQPLSALSHQSHRRGIRADKALKLLLAAGFAATCGWLASQPAGAEPLVAVPASIYYPANPQLHPLPETAVSQARVLHVGFSLKGDDDGLNDFMQKLYDPKSPLYHKWITPEEFGERFGASEDDIAAVERWATTNGMQVTYVSKSRRFIAATTTVGGAENAFSTKLGAYLRTGDRSILTSKVSPDKVVFGPRTSPQLPASIASRVTMISGLSNAFRIVPMLRPASPHATTTTNTLDPLTPSELASFYDLGTLQALSNYGSGLQLGIYEPALYSATDVAAFKTAYSIAAASPVEKYPAASSRTTADDADSVGEADLDVEAVQGLAYNAQVILYEGADDTDAEVYDEFAQMADDDLPAISFSWTFVEDTATTDQPFFHELNTYLAQMAAEGTAVFSASGDTGAYEDSTLTTTPRVILPTSSPYVTGVGGTEITAVGANSAYGTEIAWNESGDDEIDGATGGGNSIIFARPSWQAGVTGVINSDSDGYRQVPDVAAIAGDPGLNIYTGGEFEPIGGTSAAAPIWTAASLMIGKALGVNLGVFAESMYDQINSDSTVYGTAFHDITSGTNDLYACTTGWDYPTGLGSADFTKLYETFANTNASSTTGSASHTFTSGLQMISSPYNYDDASLSTLFDTTPKLAYWEPSTGAYVVTPTAPADTLEPGIGYWARLSAATTLLADAGATASGVVDVPLTAGWNMIGVPSTLSIPVSSLNYDTSAGTSFSFADASAAGYIATHLYTYSAGSSAYTTIPLTGSLVPFAGYWLYAAESGTLVIP